MKTIRQIEKEVKCLNPYLVTGLTKKELIHVVEILTLDIIKDCPKKGTLPCLNDCTTCYIKYVVKYHNHQIKSQKETLTNFLESLIDHNTLGMVLECIEEICYKKAQHLQEAWQDEENAKLWEKFAIQLDEINTYPF